MNVIVQWATILSPIIAVLIAWWMSRSSAKDTAKQIAALEESTNKQVESIKSLSKQQIEASIKMVELEIEKNLFLAKQAQLEWNGNKNILMPEHQDKIMDLYANRKDEDYLAKLVKNDDILANDCNLSVSSYVEQEDTREVINIAEVNAELAKLVAEGNELNQKIEAIIKEINI